MKKKEKDLFKYRNIDNKIFNQNPDFDITAMYERTFDEMSLQQTKRDQLITIYLAAFAFILPSLLSAEKISWVIKGWVFIGLAIIGILFSLIIIRYRIYKESYWLCLRTLTVMMDVDQKYWTKANIQGIYYKCIKKKGKSYNNKDGKFSNFQFFRKNINSAETLYLIINAFITACVCGLGIGVLLEVTDTQRLKYGILGGLFVFLLISFEYFKSLKKLYNICIEDFNDYFNESFKNVWFLHFFTDEKTKHQNSDAKIKKIKVKIKEKANND